MRSNSDLLIYPIISAFGTLLVMAVFAGSIFAIKGFDLDAVANSTRGFRLAAFFLFYFVTYAVVIFANTALVGAVMLMLDGEQRPVGPGDIAAVFRGGRHSLENTGSEDMRLLVISVREMGES